jgi:hypothetical protein
MPDQSTFEKNLAIIAEPDIQIPGICVELSKLPDGATISIEALAKIIGRHPTNIRLAIKRGELPPPVKFLGRNVWTSGTIVRHIEARLKKAREDMEKESRKLRRLAP